MCPVPPPPPPPPRACLSLPLLLTALATSQLAATFMSSPGRMEDEREKAHVSVWSAAADPTCLASFNLSAFVSAWMCHIQCGLWARRKQASSCDRFKVVLQTWGRFPRNTEFRDLPSNFSTQLFTFISKRPSLFLHKSTSFGLVLFTGGQLCYIASFSILSSPENGPWQWPRSIHHLQAEPEWCIPL